MIDTYERNLILAWNNCMNDKLGNCKDCPFVNELKCTSTVAEGVTNLIKNNKAVIVPGKPKYGILYALKEVKTDD